MPIPGPGRPKRTPEERSAMQALKEAEEAATLAGAELITAQAMEAWAKHNPALLEKLWDRTRGRVDQKIVHQLDNPMALRLSLHVASLVFSDLPDLADRLDAMARQVAAQLDNATGGWHEEADALSAGSIEPEPE